MAWHVGFLAFCLGFGVVVQAWAPNDPLALPLIFFPAMVLTLWLAGVVEKALDYPGIDFTAADTEKR